jgi:hypothetical protein
MYNLPIYQYHNFGPHKDYAKHLMFLIKCSLIANSSSINKSYNPSVKDKGNYYLLRWKA